MNKCKCGGTGELEHILNIWSWWKVRCDKCGLSTDEWKKEENAIGQWNEMNTGQTKEEKSLQEEIERKTHSLNNDLLNTSFGMDPIADLDNLLGNYKITDKGELMTEVDRLESELKKAEDKTTYWFELHNEADEEREYWYKEWVKASQKLEKLQMKLDKVKEAVE